MPATASLSTVDFHSDIALAKAPELGRSYHAVKGHRNMRVSADQGHVQMMTDDQGRVQLYLGAGDANAVGSIHAKLLELDQV